MPPRDRIDGPRVVDWVEGSPVLDLTGLDEKQRIDALLPLNRFARDASLRHTDGGSTLAHPELLHAVSEREFELLLEVRAEAREGFNRPLLTGSDVSGLAAAEREIARGRPVLRQVNVKLASAEYEVLARVSRNVGLKPTQLARQLVLNGARRLAYEQRRLTGR